MNLRAAVACAAQLLQVFSLALQELQGEAQVDRSDL